MTSDSRADRIDQLGYDYDARPKSAVATCNLCSRDEWISIVHTDRYGYNAAATTCRSCGLTQLNPRMTRDAYAEFYAEIYRPLVSAYHGRLIDATTIQGEQRLYAAHMAAFMRPYIDRQRHRSLLDVGGSTGIVAAHLAKEFGFDALVIDPAPAEAAVANQLGIRTQEGYVEEWNTTERIGIIGMCQTIDHLLDVDATLMRLREIVADDGYLVVDIVDFRAAYLRNWRIEGAIKIDHPYYLVDFTTRAYLAKSGFEVVRTSFSPDHLHIAYLCRPVAPAASFLPRREDVERLLDEIRYVQNAPRSA
jgi:SAM-dependent methyltransferase